MDTKILDKLQALCSRREYCSADVHKKAMAATGGDSNQADELVAALRKDGFVDDLRYAGAFARDKSALEGWGAYKIALQLKAKGIPESVVAEALSTMDPDKSRARLTALLTARCRSLDGDPALKLKLIKYALGRGYSYDEVTKALDGIAFKETFPYF